MTPEPVLAYGSWNNNAELMLACRQLGYLDDTHTVWDATYGEGAFWRLWTPEYLRGSDADPAKSPHWPKGVDFTDTGFPSRSWWNVVLDPPYKLNGRPDPTLDERYGIHERTTTKGRLHLIRDGVRECARVLDGGFVKCQDQVVSGAVVWQSDLVTGWASDAGLRKVDRLDLTSYRPQPAGRTQKHARRNTSQLLVFTREGRA